MRYHNYAVIRSLAILAVSLLAFKAGQAQNSDDEVHLRATVQTVVPLASFSGTVIPVHFDPLFAMTVRIESCVPAVTNFRAGTNVTLAIHSPSMLFAGEPTKGKTYDFVLHREIRDGKVRFFGLHVALPSTAATSITRAPS